MCAKDPSAKQSIKADLASGGAVILTEQDLYDSTAAWRDRAMTGTLHSGTVISDPRSDDRSRP